MCPRTWCTGISGTSKRQGRGLGEIHAHQHGADKARGVGHGHGVYIGSRHAGHIQRPLGEPGDDLHMAACRDFRHHAAVYGVQIRLRKHLIRQHIPSVLHHGDGCLVAGGFKRKYLQIACLISKTVS
jgi:hypothetical protein